MFKPAIKELSFCHKLRFANSYNLATPFSSRPLIFQTIILVDQIVNSPFIQNMIRTSKRCKIL